jgi:hypothetical protein
MHIKISFAAVAAATTQVGRIIMFLLALLANDGRRGRKENTNEQAMLLATIRSPNKQCGPTSFWQ